MMLPHDEIRACERCPLRARVRGPVPGAGDVPAQVMLVGEAPGKSEDLRGAPFVGPSGRLLREAIRVATSLCGRVTPPTYYITNCCKCRPCDAKGGSNREPNADEITTCFQWLEREYEVVQPERVVLLGKVVERNCKKLFPHAACLQHPAYVLRCGGTQSAPFKTLARGLAEVFEEVFKGRDE